MKKSRIGLILRGMGMGIAEVIPGVSGGTIAFITGIYEDLLESIKSVDMELFRKIFSFKLKEASEKVNFPFLLFLFSGMLIGLLIGIFGISHMLENYPEILWAAFFALILASIPLMLKTIKAFKAWYIIAILLSALIAYIITELSPISADANPLYIMLGGSVAIVALVLPGISGSFILLLLGLYTLIIPTLKGFLSAPSIEALQILIYFAMGCLIGLFGFSRLISAAFRKYHDLTVAIMTGFMIGSLNKIWPWRNPEKILLKEDQTVLDLELSAFEPGSLVHDSYKVLSETNVFPSEYYADPNTVGVCLSFLLSIALVIMISRYAKEL